MSAPVTAAWEPPPRLDTRLTIVSWNLWWRFGPWAARQPAIAATLQRLGPDIVCLQEVWEERDGVRQADQLADALGGYHVAHAAGLGFDLTSESLGNSIVSRWPIRAHEARPLPAPPGLDELRVVLRAEIDGPRGPVEVFVTHLNWRMDQSDVRQDQVRAICEFIAETTDQRTFPPVLAGDFNAEPESDEIRMLTGLGRSRSRSWCSSTPGAPPATAAPATPGRATTRSPPSTANRTGASTTSSSATPRRGCR